MFLKRQKGRKIWGNTWGRFEVEGSDFQGLGAGRCMWSRKKVVVDVLPLATTWLDLEGVMLR